MPVTFINHYHDTNPVPLDPARIPLALSLEPVESGFFRRRQAWLVAAGRRLARVRWKRDAYHNLFLDILETAPGYTPAQAALDQEVTIQLVSAAWDVRHEDLERIAPGSVLCSGQLVTAELVLTIPEWECTVGRAIYAHDANGRKFAQIVRMETGYPLHADRPARPAGADGTHQVRIIFGRTRLPVRELLSLGNTSSLRLDGLVSHPVRVTVDGEERFEGIVREQRGWIAVQISGSAGETSPELQALQDEIFPGMIEYKIFENSLNSLGESMVKNRQYPEDIVQRFSALLAEIPDDEMTAMLDEVHPELGVIIASHLPTERFARIIRLMNKEQAIKVGTGFAHKHTILAHFVGRIHDWVCTKRRENSQETSIRRKNALL
ncbi:MAG TPA: FliM/FliN family flagellar motor C-terminal domain-containing protein [Spirochaetota bacterium]|nr:FliM/FliN family flagellar motor C-terminal domain-containing protein [Spirochaetota bacterium]